MPFKPQIDGEKDLDYFDKVFTDEIIKQTPTNAIKDDYEGYTYEKKYKLILILVHSNRKYRNIDKYFL